MPGSLRAVILFTWMALTGTNMIHAWIHGKLNDLTLNVDHHPLLDTSEDDICCVLFAAKRSQCWQSPVRCCLSKHLWCKVYSLTCQVWQSRELQFSGAMMHAAQHHLLRSQQVIHAQYQHEQAMLPQQVPSASDHLFKNYRQKHPRCSVWITLYIKITVYSTVGLPAAVVWVRNLVCHFMGITQAEDVENSVLRKMRK
jgi:hypothetical protein